MKKKNYRELKESIRVMKTQRSDTEKIIWLKKAFLELLDKMYNYKTMLSYCLKCRKNTKKKTPKISGTSNGKTKILWNWAICGSKKSKFIKKQEANGLLSSLGTKTPLSKIPFLGNVLFWNQFHWKQLY